MTAVIEWGEAEYSRMDGDGNIICPLFAWLDGIQGEVWKDNTGSARPYLWAVQADGSRCEWPELYDAGDAVTEAEAKALAETAMRKADARYQRQVNGEW